jgi:DNA-binding LacI/PurR family transcriptional regulator
MTLTDERQSKTYLMTKKTITANDVAERAGVSKWTVSRAFTPGAYISSASLKKVMDAAQDLGYKPNLLARSLIKKRSGIIGVVVDEFTNPNVLQVLDEVTRQLQRQGFNTLLLNIDNERNFESTLQQADQFQIDGVIFLGSLLPDHFIHLIKDIRDIPLIVLFRNSDLPGAHIVNSDDYHAGRHIAKLFIEQGAKRLGYMGGPPSGSTRLERFAGFRDELQRHNVAVEICLDAGSYLRTAGRDTLASYLTREQNPIEALFCENDNLALGALDALQHSKTAMGIIGFDDQEIGQAHAYQLTTYRPAFEQLAQKAVEILKADNLTTDTVLLKGKLVKRQSHKLEPPKP